MRREMRTVIVLPRTSKKNACLASTLLGIITVVLSLVTPRAYADETGVQLSGRSDTESAPSSWSLVDLETKKAVVEVASKWGFTAAPPGRYVLRIQPYGQQTLAIDWAEITVVEGQTTAIQLNSGVELLGRSPDAAELEHWRVLDKKTEKPVAFSWRRWGFTPLPPGEYMIEILPYGHEAVAIKWADVTIEAGKTATLRLASGIEVVGRSKDDRELEHWRVLDKKTEKPIAYSWRRWGFTPLPPGEYTVEILPYGHEALKILWSDVKVDAGETATIRLSSGIEVSGRSKDDRELEHWKILDKKSRKPVAYTWRRWGFTPLPPGEYSVSILPYGHDAVEIAWTDVNIAEAKAATIRIDSGVEISGRTEDESPPDNWRVIDGETGKPAAYTWRRWGFTPLPPGEFELRLVPAGYGAVEIPWSKVTVEEGKVATLGITSGIELMPEVEGDMPPKAWEVYGAKTKKTAAAKVTGRWGFTPLPPGEYELSTSTVRWNVSVAADSVTKTTTPPLPDRLATVTGAGRKTERDRDPEGYKKLEEDVERAIRRGAAWLKQHAEFDPKSSNMGPTEVRPTIGILALIHAGEFERDEALADRCLDYLLGRSLNVGSGTYANAITAMALRDFSPHRHRSRIYECVQWLAENQGQEERNHVWGYGDKVNGLGEPKPMDAESVLARRLGRTREARRPGGFVVARQGAVAGRRDYWDNSCTQFAVLGMHAAATGQIKVPSDIWRQIDTHFEKIRNVEGGWGYTEGGSYGSMTCAGLASMIVARYHLGEKQPNLDRDVIMGLEWLASHFTVEENPKASDNHYYYLYGLERVGVLAGTEFFGPHEWYPTGARYLIDEQRGDGSWKSSNESSSDPYLDTCYAILFLRRATLPLRPDEPAQVSVTSVEGVLPAKLLPAVELILDSSGSMAEMIDGRAKTDVARDVMNGLLKELPDEMPVGLRLYGHWGEWVAARTNPNAGKVAASDPRLNTDSELVAPIVPLTPQQRKKIVAWLDFAKPRGKTPMIYSLLQARNDFGGELQGPKTVVLVSDGVDTCGGTLDQVASAYRNSGIDVVVHVVGFDIKETDAEKQLSEIAKLGGGNYYKASDARQLTAALRSALDLRFEIRNESDEMVVAHGTVGGEPVAVKPGKYRLSVQHEGIQPVSLELATGDYVDVVLDQSGQLVPASP